MGNKKFVFLYTLSFLAWYSNQVNAEKHFMYDLSNVHALEAAKLNTTKIALERKMFERFYWFLCEAGFLLSHMHDAGQDRNVRTEEFIYNMPKELKIAKMRSCERFPVS